MESLKHFNMNETIYKKKLTKRKKNSKYVTNKLIYVIYTPHDSMAV